MAQAYIKESRKHYIEYLLPFFHLLASYKFGPVSASTLGLLITGALIVFENHGKFSVGKEFKPYLYFLGFVIFRDTLRIFLGSDSVQTQINRMLEYILTYVLVFIVCSRDFDEEKLYKIWKIAGLIYTLGLLFHIFQIYILGYRIINPISLIPGYKLSEVAGIKTTRPSSFFPEPAAFVCAMLPLEFMALRRRDIKVAILTTLAILASTSTVGAILSIIRWVTTFLQRDLKARTKIIMIVATALMIYVFANIDIFSNAFTKFILVAEGGSTFGSRVTGSFEIVSAENWLEKIIGTNYNEVKGFISAHSFSFLQKSIVQVYWRSGEGNVFLNTFGQLFFKYGLIGFLLFMIPLVKYLRNKLFEAKPFVIMMMFAIFGQTMLLNSYYFMNIMLVVLFSKVTSSEANLLNESEVKAV